MGYFYITMLFNPAIYEIYDVQKMIYEKYNNLNKLKISQKQVLTCMGMVFNKQ